MRSPAQLTCSPSSPGNPDASGESVDWRQLQMPVLLRLRIESCARNVPRHPGD